MRVAVRRRCGARANVARRAQREKFIPKAISNVMPRSVQIRCRGGHRGEKLRTTLAPAFVPLPGDPAFN